MPGRHSKKAKYKHHRQKDPKEFKKKTFKTVPISHTNYRGEKFNKPGVKAIVGKHKKTGKNKIQSILESKK